MSDLIRYAFENLEYRTFIDTEGRVWFHVTDICKILKLSNPGRMVNTVISKYCREWSLGGDGRPAFYTLEPGLYKLVFQAKTLDAEKFQDEVYEKVLPEIRKKRYYLPSNLTQEEYDSAILDANTYKAENQALKAANAVLTQNHCYHSLVEDFVSSNFSYKHGSYVLSSASWERFQWWIAQTKQVAYVGLPPLTRNMFSMELDRYFKSLKTPKDRRMHISSDTEFADVENAVLVKEIAVGYSTLTFGTQIGE